MDYRVLLQEENEAVGERISLSMERICAMEGGRCGSLTAFILSGPPHLSA